MSTAPDLKRTPPADMLALSEPISTAFAAWHEAQRNAQQVVAAYNAVKRGRAAAEAADARALADATTAGEKDPGAKNVQRHERELSETKRRADAAKLIEQDRLHDVNRALRDQGPALAEALAQAGAEAFGRYEDALDVVERDSRAYAHLRAAIRWVSKGDGFKAGEPHINMGDDRVTVAELVDALRDLGEGPKSQVKEFMTPGEMVTYSGRLQRETWRH